MIDTIIKRDGSKEQFSAKKLNGWGEWSSKNLGKDVDWSEVVLHVASTAPSEITSIDLHKLFIDYCLTKPSFAYNRMAGRLYIAKLYKELYGDKIPTIKEVFSNLVLKGLMSKKFYESHSDDDYLALEKIINHKTDFELTHYQINQTMEKYSLRDRVTGEYFETPQFGMMRVAMQMCMNKSDRINRIKRHYTKYRTDKLNVPTPYYMNSGTDKLGLASCCVHNTDDTIGSLAAHNHISYMMTVNSAGQGNKIRVRSFGDPVRGGSISHQGLKPYLRAEVAMVNANLQNGRGGAETQTQDFINPEIEEILMLKNPMTPVARQVRGLDYSMFYNQFFVKKAATNQDVALFSYGDCPDLYESLDSGDDEKFEGLYNNYLKEGKAKKIIKARDLLRLALKESINVGRIYQSNSTWLNGHTPFKDPIRLSNLCVAPETKLLTKNGYEVIAELEGREVEVWNGKSWTKTTVIKTGENQELFEVIVRYTLDGKTYSETSVTCTSYHKWYDVKGNEKRTKDLELNTELLVWETPEGYLVNSYVSEIKDDGRFDSVFCANEPDRHMLVFNGVLTGNCQEIALPTHHYDSVVDLYKEDGSVSGEVAMCSLAGINVGKLNGAVGSQEWLDDYAETAWVALDMIHTAITESEYPLPHIGYTAKKRMSAGVGIVDLAHLMAKNKLKYDSQEGRDLIHRVAESHYWFLLNASLELSKEFGVAEWMNKTDWLEGWTPLKTYCKNVDEVVTVDNQFDWDDISRKIVENDGHAFSVLVAHMPAESSSIKSGATNGVYPVRDLDLNKSNDTNTVKYVVPESDKYGKYYQNAYDNDVEDIAKVYGVLQKWTDQAISADQWFKAQGSDKIKSHDLMRGWFAWNYYGVKTRYYVNTLTAKGIDLGGELLDNKQDIDWQPDSNSECEGCTL